MNCAEAKPLFADYWSRALDDGRAGDQARRTALEQHLDSCATCRAEAERLGTLWRNLALLPAEEPGAGMRERFYETFSAYRDGTEHAARKAPGSRQMLWRIAAGVVLLAAGAAAGYAVRATQAPPAEISQLRGEVSNMRQLVTLSLLQQQSASERLRGVSWAYRAEPSDNEVLTALLEAVNHDSNINVRLAAVDALRTFAANRDARDAAMQALPEQTAPIVQVALIDLMVELKDRTATPELRRVVMSDTTDSGVRQHAQWALEKLQ